MVNTVKHFKPERAERSREWNMQIESGGLGLNKASKPDKLGCP